MLPAFKTVHSLSTLRTSRAREGSATHSGTGRGVCQQSEQDGSSRDSFRLILSEQYETKQFEKIEAVNILVAFWLVLPFRGRQIFVFTAQKNIFFSKSQPRILFFFSQVMLHRTLSGNYYTNNNSI